jgi:23S rRNA pseudouridine1911/1915/1917 synthase
MALESVVTWTVSPEEAGDRLDRAIRSHVSDATRSQSQRWIAEGRVKVAGKVARPSRLLRRGEKVEVDLPPPEPAQPVAEPLPLNIVFEDEDLLVLDKPAGIVVHPAAGHNRGTLVNALLYHCSGLSGVGGTARPGIVHRLDRGTSGLMVVAKNDRAHQDLARQFAERTVEKRYLALVWGATPPRLRLTAPLGRDARDRKKISSRAPRPKAAVTEVDRLEELPGASLLSVLLSTGRTHQIRVHLSEAGHPVVGDPTYGRSRRTTGDKAAGAVLTGLNRPALHATALGFVHPRTGERLRFESPLPSDLRAVVEELRRLKPAAAAR